jgi:hypothetical protein
MASNQPHCVYKLLLRIVISHLRRFSTRREVDNANRTRLRQLDATTHTYEAEEYPGIDSNGNRVGIEAMGRLLERLIVPKSIQLKVFPFTARVSFSNRLRGSQGRRAGDVGQGNCRCLLRCFRTKLRFLPYQNLIPGELVNGSVGQIVRFRTSAEALKEHTEIAKLEGNTGPNPLPAGDWAWPVVRFISGREMMCTPHDFTVNNADGGMEARREQVSSLLSYLRCFADQDALSVTINLGLGTQRT